ncbi:unnamed protein product [Trichobilharzia szidati]|nr:unnamed protein product [Trichobilharzia szidati]
MVDVYPNSNITFVTLSSTRFSEFWFSSPDTKGTGQETNKARNPTEEHKQSDVHTADWHRKTTSRQSTKLIGRVLLMVSPLGIYFRLVSP